MLCKRTLPRALTVTNKKTTWLRVTVPDEQFGSEPDWLPELMTLGIFVE